MLALIRVLSQTSMNYEGSLEKAVAKMELSNQGSVPKLQFPAFLKNILESRISHVSDHITQRGISFSGLRMNDGYIRQ